MWLFTLCALLADTYYGTTSSWADPGGGGGSYVKEKRVGTPWRPDEDIQLTKAVKEFGENDNWKTVAKYVPGRTNKACRKRWLHSLSPNVKKTAWTPEEDEELRRLHRAYGPKWSQIAREIPGRTDDACSKRYREALDPKLKKGDWTPDEDDLLMQVIQRYGKSKWKEVGAELTRGSLSCRNRWRMLERRKELAAQQSSSSLAHSPAMGMEPIPSPSQPWLPTIPEIRTDFWEPAHSEYPLPILPQGSLPELDIPSVYLPSHYSSPSHPSQHLDSQFSSPSNASPELEPHPHIDHTRLPPFQPTSSSLSLALTLPSSSYLQTPPACQSRLLSTPSSPMRASLPPISSDVFMSNPQDFLTVPSSLQPSPNPHHTDLTDTPIPVTPHDATPQLDLRSDCSSSSSSLSPRSAVQAYPTPLSSPLIVTPTVEALSESPATSAPQSPGQNPHRHYRTLEQKKAEASKPKPKIPRPKLPDTPASRTSRATRLSSTLPVTSDATIFAYACGHSSCWPTGQTTGNNCYATSQELTEHWKFEHAEDMKCSTPFRCGLADCGKAWKSINGLQYHLQISKAHFQRALSACRSQEIEDDGAKKQKVYKCTHANCSSQYRQLSGLRYHLSHGHLDDLPTQLDDVPPTLAELVAKKTKTHTRSQSQSQDQDEESRTPEPSESKD